MTRAQAAALQAKWEQLVDPPRCEHLQQEMENSENRYVTGNYYCLLCGEPVSHS